MASAGHLPALLVHDGDARLLEGGRGPALGVTPSASYIDEVLELQPGAALFLYTDGLVERRGEAIDVALHRLRDRARSLPADLEAACDAVVAERPTETDDDVTVLALRALTSQGPGPGRAPA